MRLFISKFITSAVMVIIFSVPKPSWHSYDLARSHGWNIDGYKMWPKTTTTYYYDGDILVDTESYTHSSYVIHCDFGWGGRCNGYYIPGIFDLDNAVQYDGTASTDKTNYNWYLKILTYEKE